MTKEEAIGILNETQVVYFAPNGKKKVQEALDMAIEALSAIDEAESSAKICDICQFRGLKGNAECCYSAQQTETSDLISRADADNEICEVIMQEFDVPPTRGYEVSEKILKLLPSADEEFLNAPRITEECAIELLQMTGWLQEHDKEIGRPSGEWHRSEVGEYYKSRKLECSECGFVVCLNDLEPFFHYCPSCGARMKGGAE